MRRRSSSWLGRRRVLDGQTFEVVAVERVCFRRGLAPVLRWRSTCDRCGEAFEFRTCRKPPDAYLERKCRRHAAKPGRVVRPYLHIGKGTPGILDLIVAELPDGSLVTMRGEVIQRSRPRREGREMSSSHEAPTS